MFKVAKALEFAATIVELLRIRQEEDWTEWYLYSYKYSTVSNTGNITWQQSYPDYYQISDYSRINVGKCPKTNKVNIPVVFACRRYSSHSSISASTNKENWEKRNTFHNKLYSIAVVRAFSLSRAQQPHANLFEQRKVFAVPTESNPICFSRSVLNLNSETNQYCIVALMKNPRSHRQFRTQ